MPQKIWDLILGRVSKCRLRSEFTAVVFYDLRCDTHCRGQGSVRTIYLSILASHIFLSVVALPLVLTTLFFSLSGRFAMHRRIARFTFPIWLYVSITGVIVFAFLKVYAY